MTTRHVLLWRFGLLLFFGVCWLTKVTEVFFFFLHVRKSAEVEAVGGFRWSMLSFLNGPLCYGDL